MFAIHFRRNYDTVDDHAVIYDNLPSLEYARALRRVSGDLVVYSETGYIVIDDRWLWPWEKSNPNCYAQKAIRSAK